MVAVALTGPAPRFLRSADRPSKPGGAAATWRHALDHLSLRLSEISLVTMGAARRQLVDGGNVKVGVITHASVRGMGVALIISRCGSMPLAASFCRSASAGHTEAVLLVDHGQRQIPELHLLLNYRMGAYDQRCLAASTSASISVLLFLRAPARPPSPTAPESAPASRPACRNVARPGFRWRHQRALPASLDAGHGSQRCHHRLARPTSPCSNRCMGIWRAISHRSRSPHAAAPVNPKGS